MSGVQIPPPPPPIPIETLLLSGHSGTLQGMAITHEHALSRIQTGSYILMAAGLIGILLLGLLPALLSGLLVYHMVVFGARRLSHLGVIPGTGKIILLLFIALLVISGVALGGFALAARVSEGPDSIVALLQKMADAVDGARMYLPIWAQSYLPANIDEWQVSAADWLRQNAQYFSVIGRDAGVFFVHVLIGMIVGGMVALTPPAPSRRAPLAHALSERIEFLGQSFRRIVFSQVRISALNTLLTAIFLVIVMPVLGYDVPLVKTMIFVTFIVGLMPIIGNVISNTVICLICLSVSAGAALLALIFLIVIHKLEYFVNAHIIGSQIRARPWEILLALLVMDAAFGVAGLVAAPIFYAYMKDELSAKRLI